MASTTAIVVLVLGLALATSTHSLCVHRPNEGVKPFRGATTARTRDSSRVQTHRLIDRFTDLFLRRSYAEGREHATPQKNEAREGRLGLRAGSNRGFRMALESRELGVTETPVAKPWPEEFTINFTTKGGTATGFVAYDWSQKRQIVYHGPDSTFCIGFGTDAPCQMLEVPSGTYVYIPSKKECILAVAELGTVPPDWTVYSEYVGVEEVPGVGLCRSFAFPPTVHVWYETVEGSLPCKFVFPESTQSYYFLPETFTLGTPDEKLFDFPDYCFSEDDEVVKMVV